MLYSFLMKSARAYWPRWAAVLHRYRLSDLAAALLEAAGPLTLLGAQALYFSRSLLDNDQLDALAGMLEEDGETRAFAIFLAQDSGG